MALGSNSKSPVPIVCAEENRDGSSKGKASKSENFDAPIGFLWLKTSKKGEKYYLGNISGQDIIIFKNNDKYKKDGEGDLKIFKRKNNY